MAGLRLRRVENAWRVVRTFVHNMLLAIAPMFGLMPWVTDIRDGVVTRQWHSATVVRPEACELSAAEDAQWAAITGRLRHDHTA